MPRPLQHNRDVNLLTVRTEVNSHEKVIRLDVSVYEVLAVDVFNATDELVSQEEDCL